MTGTTGSTTGSGSSSSEVKQHWNTPINQLQTQLTSRGSNQDYVTVAKDESGNYHLYSNQDKDGGSTFLDGIRDKLNSVFSTEDATS